ncbi:ABC transporter permease [Pedobacter heparinus]|uniref:ABC-2 type transporter n=1 Tax=Pedobacter heparinus (strain ATCC 13125 / DSM 2366 / CIP 104194 / JCM 7457 / NBRC 12017 / NCIMB 9290 / NRRL B-14731 / HIM 762-3) TaxID=485917 RepID=C6XW56_PEDHD|nr:ABC transporter permease [Pedobacter heparinus]ACU04135.1 ABC-2 type transporter [Pedobacter heparinus DSM 2366]
MSRPHKPSLIQLFLREVTLVAKDHSLLLTLLIAPLLYAFFYGSIYINKEEEQVKLAVVDDDQSRLSRLLQQQINNSQLVELIHFSDLETAKEQMYSGNCQGYFYIPRGTQSNLLTLKQSNVVLAVNAARFLPSSDLLMSVQQICLTVGAGIRLQYFEKSEGLSRTMAMQNVMPITLDYRPMFNERSSYGAFLLPALLALILQQTLLIGLSESVAGERQQGSIKEWFKAGISTAIWGKGLFYLVVFGAYGFFFLNVNFRLLNLPMRGSGFQLGVLLLFLLFTLIPMAQFIGSLFRSQLLCLQVMAFSTYPIFLITGYTWPFESLPVPIQWVSMLLPTTPFIKIYTAIVQSGADLLAYAAALLHLLLLWLLYSTACYIRFRKLARQSKVHLD